MRNIIFVNYLNNINGAVIDVLDYFITIYEYNPKIELLIVNLNKEFKSKLSQLLQDRYDLKGLNIESNIIGIKRNDLIRYRFDRILILDYGTIKHLKGYIFIKDKSSKIIIISDLYTEQDEYWIDPLLYPEKCVTYYGEMPYVYKDIQYTIKQLLDRLKPVTKVEPNILVYSPDNTDCNFIKTLNLPDKKIIFKTVNHKQNFFELFDTFLYYRDKCFDARPRLFIESTYFNKDIIYINPDNIQDGSYYRYNDVITNGIDHRFLNKDDIIVQQFI